MNQDKRVILLAEDTELLLEIQRSLLQRESFDLITARTGEQALEKAVELKPHLIILSDIMSDSSGREVCSTIKSDPAMHGTKVIIATSNPSREVLAECVDAGCDGIVTKPFEREKLLESVQKLLGETFRRKPRFQVDIQCAVYVNRQGFPANMLDISEIGCRLEMDDPPTGDTRVEVSFDLPETVQSVNWKGIVRWSVPKKRKSEFSGIGVEFIDVPMEETDILRDILDYMPVERKV
jgi:CheY-like chemotaxis protein